MCANPLIDLLLDRVCGRGGVEVSHRAIHGHVKTKRNKSDLWPGMNNVVAWLTFFLKCEEINQGSPSAVFDFKRSASKFSKLVQWILCRI